MIFDGERVYLEAVLITSLFIMTLLGVDLSFAMRELLNSTINN